MSKAKWYVAQVRAGRENAACDAIRHACLDDNTILEECFSPIFITRAKFSGQWRDIEKPLFPGYVIAVTTEPDELNRRLLNTTEYIHFLSLGEAIVPLREDERAWLEETTVNGERVVPISIGHRVGDIVEITDGPLKGREAMVTRIMRKKCMAMLELHVGGKTIAATVGLAVLPAYQTNAAANDSNTIEE